MSEIKIKHLDKFFAGGEWLSAHGDTIELINPSTEALYTTVTGAAEEDVDRAVAAAREAFDTGPWPRMAPAERAGYIRKLARGLEARAEEMQEYFINQVGGLCTFAPGGIGMALGVIAAHADYAEQFEWEREYECSIPGHRSIVCQEPVGVVAAICPWNMPLPGMAQKVSPALATGCTVVMKPSPESPLEAMVLADVAREVGFPEGVINLVTADRKVSDYLVRHVGVDKISFTGSTVVGRHIASVASERMARVTLELGGKSPAIVLDDFPSEAAAKILGGGALLHTGQICGLLSRAIVPASRHDELAEMIAAVMQAVKVGSAHDPASQMGPLAMKRQLERVQNYVQIGIDEGAELRCGGKRPASLDKGYFIEPTLFTHVDNSMRIAQEEIFGPVLCLIPADDLDHAIALANDTIYGLNSAVLTHNTAKFREVAPRIQAGNVAHNGLKTDFNRPVAGHKQSGIGREGGFEGMGTYTQPKKLVIEIEGEGGSPNLFRK